MNPNSLLLKTATVILLLLLMSLAGAITWPAFSTVGTTGIGLNGLLIFLGLMIILSVIGNLLAKGIRTIKKPWEALLIAFVGSLFMGAMLLIFTVLNLPGTARINTAWLGASWYSPLLTFLFIGTPLMLVFIVVD